MSGFNLKAGQSDWPRHLCRPGRCPKLAWRQAHGRGWSGCSRPGFAVLLWEALVAEQQTDGAGRCARHGAGDGSRRRGSACGPKRRRLLGAERAAAAALRSIGGRRRMPAQRWAKPIGDSRRRPAVRRDHDIGAPARNRTSRSPCCGVPEP